MPLFQADAERPDPRAVLRDIPLGRRVVVRSLIEGGERATDALGELIGRDAESVLVRTRTADVRLELAQVVAAKQVPASPGRGWRVAPFLRRGGVAVLGDGTMRTADGFLHTPTADLVQDLLGAGTPVVVLGHPDAGQDDQDRDDDRGAVDPGGSQHPLSVTSLLAPGELTREVLAGVHREIEDHLGRTVGRGTVHYTDARPGAVDTARAFGWQGRVFTLPPVTTQR